ncbi:MAG TPA: LodA/GoxA family CTQ-dependent oxidase, partial [Methylomirabilota bacterium]|nr:LodA/GoxA family CTQ-dependent oxidase [Methylomirabilota bacterium]
AQDVTARGQAAYGETLSFDPWRTPEAHAPVGSVAEARRVVYQASAALRRHVNGEPVGEPAEPRPGTVWPPARDTRVVRAAIHPGIGVARLGDSTAADGDYVGPEVVGAATPPGHTRDAAGAIKRQAARFRLYGYNAAGEVVGELGADDAHIQWTVHLANRKAQWYRFLAALDIPDAQGLKAPRRNAKVRGAERSTLAIDPGPRTIHGKSAAGPEHRFDSGTFRGTAVFLGELRTDEAGRLLVLGGHGVSASPAGLPIYDPADPDSFSNADGWYDDVADGPVTATVSVAGRAIPVEPSWVVVAPPNYAPDVAGWRTLYDLLVDTYVEAGWLSLPETVSFTKDVWPVLRRLSGLQWVNAGFAATFGRGGPLDFEDPSLVEKLAHRPRTAGDPDPYAELRQVVANAFRPPATDSGEPRTWPWIYGDAFGSFPATSPRTNLALSGVRATLLRRWVEGDFVDDRDGAAPAPRTLDEVPLAEQPAMLDRAALHFCLADAFHPGCEMTWPLRHATLYSAPFRIRPRAPHAA